MPGDPGGDRGSNAVAILATGFVVLGGAVTCAFITLAFSENPRRPLLILVGCLLGYMLIMWLLRDREPDRLRQRYFWLLPRRRRVEKVKIRIGRMAPQTPPPANAPPTVETIRDLKDHVNTWVPSSLPPDQRPGRG